MVQRIDSQRAVFGRDTAIAKINNVALGDNISGILIEGETSIGKTLLAEMSYNNAGQNDIWLHGDRVLQNSAFGVFAPLVDLSEEVHKRPSQVVSVLKATGQSITVFIDDAHFLDQSSIDLLSSLTANGEIKVVATTRTISRGQRPPFFGLVDEYIIDHLILEALSDEDCRAMVEHIVNGIISQGVLDFVAYYSGKIPGRIIEFLRYTTRHHLFVERGGVFLLNGTDVVTDSQTQDFERLARSQYTKPQREAWELIALSGEADIEVMIAAGLGEAADSLTAAGVLHFEQGDQVYTATNPRTLKPWMPIPSISQCRQRFELISQATARPSALAQVKRTEWALMCAVPVSDEELIEQSSTAAGNGDWHSAIRLLCQISLDQLDAHSLFALARLYCDANKAVLGSDLLAQALSNACCPELVLNILVVWTQHDYFHESPALKISDFTTAVDRLYSSQDRCASSQLSTESTSILLASLTRLASASDSFDRSELSNLASDELMRPSVTTLATLYYSSILVDTGRYDQAVPVLNSLRSANGANAADMIRINSLYVRALVQLGRVREAKNTLKQTQTHDPSYLATVSGPNDLSWSLIHMLEGRLPAAIRALQAAVESLTSSSQTAVLAIALAEGEYATTLAGMTDKADEFSARFDHLPEPGFYRERTRATILHTTAQWLRTGDPAKKHNLKKYLSIAQADESIGDQALLRIIMFRHFDDFDPDEMLRVASLGNGREFELLSSLGTALRGRDVKALLDLVQRYEPSMPDLAAKCAELATGYSNNPGYGRHTQIHRVLTAREHQISALIIAGKTNQEIADEIGIRLRTVEGHTYRLFRKLGISRREQVAKALRRS